MVRRERLDEDVCIKNTMIGMYSSTQELHEPLRLYEGRNTSLRRSASMSPVAAADEESKAQFSKLEFRDWRRLLDLVSGRV
ncbi:uncharacterized protein A4U43_C01F22300 [Asparagus officinalis]|uniref:Uncharacterized protein n=1 Tax=Asparagus officinalis TaxID=4686 RepID=A0A5P1FT32_ASPOF|nr:uncharacterized protein A4U43_C01F22300 [Asparagus officinalis]